MGKVLGIDLGTNSIGWAMVEDSSRILGMGSRVFKEGVNKDTSGKEVSKSAARRAARGARRGYYRRRMRKARLKKLLDELGLTPDKNLYTSEKLIKKDKEDKKYLTIELYKLRVEALERKLTLGEIGRIFEHLNQRRGFKSNSKLEKKSSDAGVVKKEIATLKNEIDSLLDDGVLRYGTVGEYFFHLIRLNQNSHNPNEPKIRIRKRFIDRSMYEEEFDKIWDKQAEYYPKILTRENKKRLKDETIYYQRNLRSQKHLVGKCKFEFTLYKDKNGKPQKSYLRTCPLSCFEFQEFRMWQKINDLRYNLGRRREIELTQEQKNIFADDLQEFGDLVFKPRGKEEKKRFAELLAKADISEDAKFNFEKIEGNRTLNKIYEALGRDFVNELILSGGSDLSGNRTLQTIWHNIHFSETFVNSGDWLAAKDQKSKRWKKVASDLKLNEGQLERLADTGFEDGYSSYSLKAIKKILPYMKEGMNLRHAEEKLGYWNDNAGFAESELSLLVPPLKTNELRNPVVQKAASQLIKLINAIIKSPKYGRPDEIRIELIRDLKMPRQQREKKTLAIRNKEALKKFYAAFLSEKLGRVVDPSSSKIKKFELYVELNYSQESFNSISSMIDLNEFNAFYENITLKDTAKLKLWLECDRILPYTGEQIGLAQLLSAEIEIEHIIPYSRCADNSMANKTLSTRTFNALKGNLTPLEYFENRPKKELDDFTERIRSFKKAKRERFLITKDELKSFSNSQLTDTAYIARLISQHLMKSFKADNIKTTNGSVTAMMRKFLGFDGLLSDRIKIGGNYPEGSYRVYLDENGAILGVEQMNGSDKKDTAEVYKEGYIQNGYFYSRKNREDHRHHAIDALAVALTSDLIIENISLTSSMDDFDQFGLFTKAMKEKINKLLSKEIDVESVFNQAKKMTSEIFVSNEDKQRIKSSSKKRIYKNGKLLRDRDGNILFSGGDVSRLPLHQEYLYGSVTFPGNNKQFVIRKKIADLKEADIKNIVDPGIRRIIEKRLNSGISLSDLIKRGIYLPNRNGQSIEIRKIRISVPGKFYSLRRQLNEKLYVKPGGNYVVAIYGDLVPSSRRNSRGRIILSNFETVTKSNNKERINSDLIPQALNGRKLLYTIKKGDYFIIFNNHPDEINWEDKILLSSKLYRVNEMNGEALKTNPAEVSRVKIILNRHNIAKPDSSHIDPITKLADSITFSENNFRGIKVLLNELGEIINAEENN